MASAPTALQPHLFVIMEFNELVVRVVVHVLLGKCGV